MKNIKSTTVNALLFVSISFKSILPTSPRHKVILEGILVLHLPETLGMWSGTHRNGLRMAFQATMNPKNLLKH